MVSLVNNIDLHTSLCRRTEDDGLTLLQKSVAYVAGEILKHGSNRLPRYIPIIERKKRCRISPLETAALALFPARGYSPHLGSGPTPMVICL